MSSVKVQATDLRTALTSDDVRPLHLVAGSAKDKVMSPLNVQTGCIAETGLHQQIELIGIWKKISKKKGEERLREDQVTQTTTMEETPQERETAEEEMSIEMTSMRGEDMKGETARIMVTAPTENKTIGGIIGITQEEANHRKPTETSVEAHVLKAQKEVTGMGARAVCQAMVNCQIQVVYLLSSMKANQ